MKLRTKLVLAMMLLVAGITALALVASQVQVERAYRRALESQFEAELRAVFALQQARLGGVRARGRRLARSVRLLAALEEGDAERVYLSALDELRDVLEPSGEAGESAAIFFRLLDAEGRVLPTDEPAAGAAPAAMVERLARMPPLSRAREQEVGYLADGAGGAVELVVTKIVDPVGGGTAGALVLGFPFAAVGGVSGAPIRSALLLDGQVLAPALAPDARAALGRLLEPGGRAAVSTFRVDGVPYLVLDKVLNPDSAFPPAVELGLYPLDVARREQARLRRLVLGAGTAALVLAFALSAALAHGLTVPVRDLIRGTHEIRGGNYAHRVAVRGRDELAGLGAAFNEMAAGLAQKDRYRHVLDAVTDRRVAEELLAGAIELGGELRDVGILFCDIRGFTALTERMAPTEVIALLNEHMTAMTAVVHAGHGVVDKFVGDQIMAIFGAPLARGTEMHDMAHAALRMIAERERLNVGAARAIEIGVGMAAGQVVAGCMGSRQRLNYTVLGERVNLAARLCQAAGPMDVVMDEIMRERLGDRARVAPLAPLVAKGFSGPVQAYHLLGLVEGA